MEGPLLSVVADCPRTRYMSSTYDTQCDHRREYVRKRAELLLDFYSIQWHKQTQPDETEDVISVAGQVLIDAESQLVVLEVMAPHAMKGRLMRVNNAADGPATQFHLIRFHTRYIIVG
ncbi:hypothetical protein KIPB_016185 [Kipferlia bialata]|uniref:Uncharacterized protein n=1 Tax=Kipferlia bialata TaxID=797122 RepID=A0A391P591_9EUKA|nr:hypothetical protein KIPB_016185 [Kipferlia bialata]|eukprot:g16185.t1